MDGNQIIVIVLSLCGSLALALALTPLASRIAKSLRIVDRPDGKRKLQTTAIPLLGGVAVCLAIVGVVFLLTSFHQFTTSDFSPLGFAASLLLICAVGVYDDAWNIRARYKLIAQVLCTLPLVLSGCVISQLGLCGFTLDLGPWSGVCTIVWLVSGINAVNVVDGMDGLAATVGLCIAAGIAAIGAITGAVDCVLLAAVLIGALAGFLIFNLPPARVYLGDAGSMVIGLSLSALALHVATDAAERTSLTLMVVLLALPLADLALAVVRRALSGCGICSPDRGHIHHRLLERGFTVSQALRVAASICLVSGAIASGSRVVGWEPLAWALSLVLAVILVRARLAGHIEWAMTKRRLLRVWPGVELPLPTREQIATLPFDEVWSRLVASADRLSMQGVELSLRGSDSTSGPRRDNRLHRWHSTAYAEPAVTSSTVEIVMFTIRAETVRLRLEPDGDTETTGPAWQSLLKAARLAVAHWAESPQTVPDSTAESAILPLAANLPIVQRNRAA